MSQAELARRAKLTRGTVRNTERGLNEPSPDTVARIRAVLPLEDPNVDRSRRPEAFFTPTYAPLQYAEQMAAVFRSRGGDLDQAWLYLEPQSALDWLRYCSDAAYIANYRDRYPKADIADRVAALVGTRGVDVVALGAGDAYVEIRLISHLLRACGQPVHLDLVDLSHQLLFTAFRAARDALASSGVRVHPIHGDFYGLAGYEELAYRSPKDERRRLWTLIGNTVGNLRDEPLFFRDLAQLSRPGDLMLLDYQLAPAPADDPALADKERLLHGPLPSNLQAWITGPLRRALSVEFGALQIDRWLNTSCPVRGSYAVMVSATVQRGTERVEYRLARFKRYEERALSAALAPTGWREVASFRYGPEPKMCGVLLAERTE